MLGVGNCGLELRHRSLRQQRHLDVTAWIEVGARRLAQRANGDPIVKRPFVTPYSHCCRVSPDRSSHKSVLVLVREEYAGTPGVRLTLAQACRLRGVTPKPVAPCSRCSLQTFLVQMSDGVFTTAPR